jgi:hypothetical protein
MLLIHNIVIQCKVSFLVNISSDFQFRTGYRPLLAVDFVYPCRAMSFLVKNANVVDLDPHWFQCGSVSSSGSRVLMKLKEFTVGKKSIFFYIKNCNLLIPRPR